MLVRPEPRPKRTAKMMPPVIQGAVDSSTVNPVTRKVAEMTAKISGESPRPANILTKRLTTCEGPTVSPPKQHWLPAQRP